MAGSVLKKCKTRGCDTTVYRRQEATRGKRPDYCARCRNAGNGSSKAKKNTSNTGVGGGCRCSCRAMGCLFCEGDCDVYPTAEAMCSGCRNARGSKSKKNTSRRKDIQGPIKFTHETHAVLLKHARRKNAYVGGTTDNIEDYINQKRIVRKSKKVNVRVKFVFRNCYYRETRNVRRAEDSLLAEVPDCNRLLGSGLRDDPGYVYVLRG